MWFVKRGLRLLGTHAVMSLIQFIFMPSLFSILENADIPMVNGNLYIAVFWFIIYLEMSEGAWMIAKRALCRI